MNEQITKLMSVSQFQNLSINLQNGIWDGFGGNQFKAVMFCLEVRIFQSKEWGYISEVTLKTKTKTRMTYIWTILVIYYKKYSV